MRNSKNDNIKSATAASEKQSYIGLKNPTTTKLSSQLTDSESSVQDKNDRIPTESDENAISIFKTNEIISDNSPSKIKSKVFGQDIKLSDKRQIYENGE